MNDQRAALAAQMREFAARVEQSETVLDWHMAEGYGVGENGRHEGWVSIDVSFTIAGAQ